MFNESSYSKVMQNKRESKPFQLHFVSASLKVYSSRIEIRFLFKGGKQTQKQKN